MTLLAGFIAQLLHIALIAIAAPMVVGILGWLRARLAGAQGPSMLQPLLDLVRLLRKEPVVAESASSVTAFAPAVGAASVAVSALLVPLFACGMILAPLADLLLIAALLMTGRVCLALAEMDAGSTPGGLNASRAMLLGCLAEPALLLVLFTLALQAGSLNADQVATTRLEGGIGAPAAAGAALAAAMLVALVDVARLEPPAADLGGRDLALIEATRALRLLVWFNLLGAMFLPFGMALPDAGPIAWLAGIVAWLFRTLVFAMALALHHAVLGHVRLPRAARMLGVAVLLGFLAAAFVLAGMTSV
jgi:formate hydrogenlyase subunit 4